MESEERVLGRLRSDLGIRHLVEEWAGVVNWRLRMATLKRRERG
jgi:hypothetical protein